MKLEEGNVSVSSTNYLLHATITWKPQNKQNNEQCKQQEPKSKTRIHRGSCKKRFRETAHPQISECANNNSLSSHTTGKIKCVYYLCLLHKRLQCTRDSTSLKASSCKLTCKFLIWTVQLLPLDICQVLAQKTVKNKCSNNQPTCALEHHCWDEMAV